MSGTLTAELWKRRMSGMAGKTGQDRGMMMEIR